MINLMVKEYIISIMKRDMKEPGLMENVMEMVIIISVMVINLKVSLLNIQLLVFIIEI